MERQRRLCDVLMGPNQPADLVHSETQIYHRAHLNALKCGHHEDVAQRNLPASQPEPEPEPVPEPEPFSQTRPFARP